MQEANAVIGAVCIVECADRHIGEAVRGPDPGTMDRIPPHPDDEEDAGDCRHYLSLDLPLVGLTASIMPARQARFQQFAATKK
jgi:hypothetical protein